MIQSLDASKSPESRNEKNNIFDETKAKPDANSHLDLQRRKAMAEKEKNKGNEAMKAQEWDEAVTFYQKAVNLDPGNHLIYGNMAQAYLNLKKNKECIQTCNTCIQIDSQFTKAYYRRAKAHINMKNYLEGAKDFKRILILEPENSTVKEELETIVKKQLGEAQVKELDSLTVVVDSKQDKPSAASQPQSSVQASPVTANQPQTFKRVNIVEEEDEDEEEEGEVEQPTKPVALQPKPAVAESQPAQEDISPPKPAPAPVAPKIDKSVFLRELAKVQEIKTQATDEIKKSMYETAVSMMKKTTEFFEDEDERLIGLTNDQLQEYFNLKMSLHANIALCYQQMDFPKKVIEFSDIVLDTFSTLTSRQLQKDFGLLEKTLHRKALALEKCEKFKDARVLYYEIRKLNPTNKMASQGIQRCDEYLEDRHVDLNTPSSYLAGGEKVAQPAEPVARAPEKKLEPLIPQQTSTSTQPAKPAKVEEISSGLGAALSVYLAEYEKQKEGANNAFRDNKFEQAATLYSKLIEEIEQKHPDVVGKHTQSFADNTQADLLKLFVSLLSNRSMSYIKTNKFLLGLMDCQKILRLDPKNPKVYHRQYVCQEELARELRTKRRELKEKEVLVDLIGKELVYLQGAAEDLKLLASQTKDPQYQKKLQELDQLISLGTKQRQGLESELKASKSGNERKVVVEELGATEVSMEEKSPSGSVGEKKSGESKKTGTSEGGAAELDIDQITKKALHEIIEKTGQIPNPNRFELEMKSFKDHYGLMWRYFEKFQNWDFLTVVYAKRELDAKYLEQVVSCLLHKVHEDASRAEDASQVLLSVKKTHNSKLSLKFLAKSAKTRLAELLALLLKTVANAAFEYALTTEFSDFVQ